MKRKLMLGILLGLVMLSATAALAGGDIYGGGPWGTRITTLPYTINASGAYFLSGNLSYAGGNGITVASDDVTLDLMGFTLTGPGNYSGIVIGPHKNVEIRNGTVTGWRYAIDGGDGAGVANRVINIRADSNYAGVYLHGSGHLIQGCRATADSSVGYVGLFIQANGRISDCVTKDFGVGIEIDSNGIISDNVVIGSASSFYGGIYAGTDSLVLRNQVTNAHIGIFCHGVASVISNTVKIFTGQTGVNVLNAATTLLDQNTVIGPNTDTSHHYTAIDLVATRNNNY